MADSKLFVDTEAPEAISGQLADFLSSLDLQGLGENGG
jgi:hypothetical protein